MTIGLIVAALILPPLAIFMARGITRNFWISLGLT
ncbi:YqaE/Pmp3 family membrane protein, partial [Allosphingosinicella sp.]